MVIRLTSRREAPLDWPEANPVLAEGEVGVEKGEGGAVRFKIGDGATPWNGLPYCGLPPSAPDGGVPTGSEIDGGNASN